MKLRDAKLKILLVVGAALLLGGMILLAVAWKNSVRDSDADWDYVRHTREVIHRLHEFKISLLELETTERGYLITGRDIFAERNGFARLGLENQRRELRYLIVDNGAQHSRINAMQPLLERRMASSARLFSLRDDHGMGAALPLIVAGVDQAQSDEIVDIIDEMLAEEYQLLDVRRANLRKSLDRRSDLATISGAIILALSLALAWAVHKDLKRRAMQFGQLDEIAHHDMLTGLANRRHFMSSSDALLALAKRNSNMAAVLMLDLDGFKGVNDIHGHAAGDLLLKEVGRRILSQMRSSDVVARLGGDEFVIFLPVMESVEGVRVVAMKLILTLGLPYELETNSPISSVGTSIGIAWYPDHGDNLEILMHHADMALYEAKRAGKRCYAIYNRNTTKETT